MASRILDTAFPIVPVNKMLWQNPLILWATLSAVYTEGLQLQQYGTESVPLFLTRVYRIPGKVDGKLRTQKSTQRNWCVSHKLMYRETTMFRSRGLSGFMMERPSKASDDNHCSSSSWYHQHPTAADSLRTGPYISLTIEPEHKIEPVFLKRFHRFIPSQNNCSYSGQNLSKTGIWVT